MTTPEDYDNGNPGGFIKPKKSHKMGTARLQKVSSLVFFAYVNGYDCVIWRWQRLAVRRADGRARVQAGEKAEQVMETTKAVIDRNL